jgi:hypothetical protein
MKKLFLFFILAILVFNSNGQSASTDWVITTDTIKGKINWVLDDMVSITAKKDSQTQILYLKDIYKYFFEGKSKLGKAPMPIIKENWVITKDTIWGRINWVLDDMVNITQVKDSQTLILYTKNIYQYFFEGIVKFGKGPKPINKSNQSLNNSGGLEAGSLMTTPIFNDSALSQKIMEHERILIKNNTRLDNVQSNLTLFHQQYKKGRMINIYSVTIPTGAGLIGYGAIQSGIHDLNAKLEPTKQIKDAKIASIQYRLNNGQITQATYNFEVMQANSEYDTETKDIQNQIEKKQNNQRNLIIGTSLVTCIGVLVGTSIINGAYEYIGKAGEFTVDLNKITYTYRF